MLKNCELKNDNARFEVLAVNDLYIIMNMLHVNDVLNAITVLYVKRRQDVL